MLRTRVALLLMLNLDLPHLRVGTKYCTGTAVVLELTLLRSYPLPTLTKGTRVVVLPVVPEQNLLGTSY